MVRGKFAITKLWKVSRFMAAVMLLWLFFFLPLWAEVTNKDCLVCHDDESLSYARYGVKISLHVTDQHLEGTPHEGFDCVACHTSATWSPANLRYHTFPLDHGGAGDVACQVCHPDGYVTYTCFGCHEHESERTERRHRREGLRDIADCVLCHTTGEVEEDD